MANAAYTTALGRPRRERERLRAMQSAVNYFKHVVERSRCNVYVTEDRRFIPPGQKHEKAIKHDHILNEFRICSAHTIVAYMYVGGVW